MKRSTYILLNKMYKPLSSSIHCFLFTHIEGSYYIREEGVTCSPMHIFQPPRLWGLWPIESAKSYCDDTPRCAMLTNAVWEGYWTCYPFRFDQTTKQWVENVRPSYFGQSIYRQIGKF